MTQIADYIIDLLVTIFNRVWHRSMKKSAQNAHLVSITLKELIKESGADRAIVYQFHNGVKSIMGVPFYYYSATHEEISDAPNVYPIAAKLQRIPTSTIPFVIDRVLRNNFRFRDVAEIEDAVTRSQCIETGLKSVVIVPLYSPTKKPIGMLGLGWVNHQAPDFDGFGSNSSDELYSRLINEVKHIASLL